ncbi:MAG TPA: ATP-binding protein [Candidatus Limnocylindria bacterium]|nr:ATP-binding protein [Candidatus Limnocylindria bacterium]
MMRSFSSTVGLRRAAAIIFALVAVLPMLAVLPVLHTAGVLASPYAQVSLLLAVGLAVLGFFVLRRLTDEVARLADGFANPTPTTAVPAATVPGLGRVTEIGQIGDALTHMLNDLRASTDRLEDLVFKLSTLNEVVELAARIPQMQDLLALVLERTMRTVRASIGSIMLLDHERQVLRVVAARGLPDDVVEHAEVAVGESIAGKVVQLGEPVFVEDISTDPRFARTRDPKYGSGAFMCLPVRVEDRIIGVVNLAKSAAAAPTPAFSPTDLQFLNTLMTHIAYAVDNARLLQEAQLSTNRLRRAMEDLRTTQTRIVEGETLRAVGQMASGMAHHVNNLLAVISGRVQLLLGRTTQPEVRRPLEIVQQATFDAADVVRRVLGFTAVQPVISGASVDLNDIVREVAELTRPRWRDEAQIRSAALDVVLELGEVPRVNGDASALREVVMNLLFNAIDAMQQSGTIRITTWGADDWAHCSVADTGVGMSDEVRAHAIEPFFTTKGPRGTGLGLSVSHSVMQRHGGELSLRPNEGGGTVVTLRLPRAVALEPAKVEPAPLGAPLRILLVDDEPTVREALADTLVEDGHAVVQAPSGPEALARLGEGTPVDLVFTDLGMPEMTGWDVARAIRQRWPGLPVVLVTGWAVALEMSDEEKRGVDFVLAKPYTVETLRSALAAVRP